MNGLVEGLLLLEGLGPRHVPPVYYFGKIGRIAPEEVTFALIKSKCLPVLLYGTEACPINSAMRHSLQFALNRARFKIFGALSKDTYKDICKYFGMGPMDEQISARQRKFY